VDKLETIKRYKYLPFDIGSLKIITQGTIKFTKPSEFNDPFDCDPGHDCQWSLKISPFRSWKNSPLVLSLNRLFLCRLPGQQAGLEFFFEAIAFALDADRDGVVQHPVEDGAGDDLVAEGFSPVRIGLI